MPQAAVCAYALAFFLRPSSPMRLTRGGLSARIMRRGGTVGLTPFLIMAVDNVMIISINAALQRYGGAARGDMLVAANAIVQSFMMVITMPLGGITVGTQSILGYNYGARQIDRVWRAEKYIFALAHALDHFTFPRWLGKDKVCINTCNDGLRPVTFKMEVVE